MLNWDFGVLIDPNGFPVNAIRDLQAILLLSFNECSYVSGHGAFHAYECQMRGCACTTELRFPCTEGRIILWRTTNYNFAESNVGSETVSEYV